MAAENILETIFREATFFSAREEEITEIPITLEDALNGEERDQWENAIDEELGTLKKMGTWEHDLSHRDFNRNLAYTLKMMGPLPQSCSLRPCILFWHLQHQ